ncbi:hypothetical protein CDD81_3490 [Ophiocordyceps australis]|uniref:Uncharacterized protein n=1 Tax=Ophiocordyceps australis TaxID=1399860 RepID=A0A2C5YCU3_9HYPO|nr:hypothetical protein CDD81_3490 [Ophiocordyceps australis]
MFTSWRLATPESTNTPFTTSWYTPTLGLDADEPLVTNTIIYDVPPEPLDQQADQGGCGVPDEAWDDLDWDHMSDACRSLVESQCFPEPGQASLPLATIPKECLLPVLVQEELLETAWPSNYSHDSAANSSWSHYPMANHSSSAFSISNHSVAPYPKGNYSIESPGRHGAPRRIRPQEGRAVPRD